MITAFKPQLLSLIEQLENVRESRVLLLSASHLDMEILPALYQQLMKIGKVKRLDVVLQSKGGEVNAARRIALLLREFTDHLSFIVPYYCESSATILTLASDEIIAGQMAIFSPIDPHLHGGEGDITQADTALSCMDIQMFGEMSEDWFGLDKEAVRKEALSLLCQSIFPPTLTTFYRSTQEVKQIGEELIAFQLPQLNAEQRASIVKHLMFDYHSHGYAITRNEMSQIGLNIKTAEKVESLAWELSIIFQENIGGGLRQDPSSSWRDALIASQEGISLRENPGGGLMPKWLAEEDMQNVR